MKLFEGQSGGSGKLSVRGKENRRIRYVLKTRNRLQSFFDANKNQQTHDNKNQAVRAEIVLIEVQRYNVR